MYVSEWEDDVECRKKWLKIYLSPSSGSREMPTNNNGRYLFRREFNQKYKHFMLLFFWSELFLLISFCARTDTHLFGIQ